MKRRTMLLTFIFALSVCVPMVYADGIQTERLSELRIREYRTHYQKLLTNASWARKAMVGSVAALVAGTGYLGYRWATGSSEQPTQTPESKISDSTLKEFCQLSKKEGRSSKEEARLKLLKEQLEVKNLTDQAEYWKKQQEFREYDRTFKGMAKRNFLIGITGGISFAVMSLLFRVSDPLKDSVAGKVKELWYRSEKQYFDVWQERMASMLEQLRALIVYLANNPNMHVNKASSAFYSYIVQLVSAHRMFIFATERVVSIMTLKPGLVPAREVAHVKHCMNTLSDAVERTVENATGENPAPDQELVTSFMQAHDSLMLLLQSYTVAQE